MNDQMKFTWIRIGVVLLTITVVDAKTYKASSYSEDINGSIKPSSRAVELICQNTDYKRSCQKIFMNVSNSDDPKRLMKIAFKSAIKELQIALENSYILQELAKDTRTYDALAQCKEALNASIDDLNRSLEKLDEFDLSMADQESVADLQIWLSGSLTYQETCREGFVNTIGEAGEKMMRLMWSGWMLTSNGLAMVNAVGKSLGGLEVDVISTKGDNNKRVNSDQAWWESGGSNILEPKRVVVAQDGSGSFRTIMGAVRTVPRRNKRRFVIHIKQGVYKENVDIPRHVNNIVFIGDGPTKTKVTGSLNYDDGIDTFKTATVAINGDRFVAKDIGFENTAGPEKHQAAALRVSGDMAIFHNCTIDGYQDTLYAHSYRQFYRECTIKGTIDFIFGDAAAIFQNCKMIVKKPLDGQEGMVTAQGRKDRHSKGALILQACIITADPDFFAANPMPKSYLGRPLKELSRTIIMQSFIDNNISPEGWSPWDGTFALDTCYYAEYRNIGPSADTTQRVRWKCIKKISLEEASSYTLGTYIHAGSWIQESGVPYDTGLIDA